MYICRKSKQKTFYLYVCNMENIREAYWKYALIAIIVTMAVIIFRHLTPFLGGLLGSFTIYILVRKQMFYLTGKRHMRPSIGALLVTGEVVLVFLVPFSLVVWMMINTLQDITLDSNAFIAPIQQTAEIIHEKTGYDVWGKDTQAFLVTLISRIVQTVMGWLSSFMVNICVMVFVLYFMLMGGRKMENYLKDLLPFNKRNVQEVTHKTHMIVRSNAIGIPLLALIQGSVATLGYFIFDAPNILLLGFLTCFTTVIPMVGTALVWVPLAAYLAINGEWVNAIGIFIYGAALVSQLDNLIRFILQKQMANIHPLITIFGVVIGLQLFGFMGVIFGPLLLSLFCLFVDIFKKEYLESRNNPSAK